VSRKKVRPVLRPVPKAEEKPAPEAASPEAAKPEMTQSNEPAKPKPLTAEHKKMLPKAYNLVKQSLKEASTGQLPIGYGSTQLWAKIEASMNLIGQALDEAYPEETPKG
jgi:hypothetical protein